MPTILYIVRHVQAEGNLKRIFHGHTDGDITEFGAAQGELLRARFETVPLTAAVASDLTRAVKTAGFILASHPDVPLTLTPALREIHAGVWEGQNFEGLGELYPDEYRRFQAGDETLRPGGGESIGEVAARMRAAADAFVRAHSGGVLLLVSHGCAIRSLLSSYAGRPLDWGKNASVSKVVYPDGGAPVIESMWDDSHLVTAGEVKEL